MAINDPITERQSGEFYFFGPRLEGKSDSNCMLVDSIIDKEEFDYYLRCKILIYRMLF